MDEQRGDKMVRKKKKGGQKIGREKNDKKGRRKKCLREDGERIE